MTKREIKKAKDEDLIVDYVKTYAYFYYNFNTGGGLKQLGNHMLDLEKEMNKRNILSDDAIRRLQT